MNKVQDINILKEDDFENALESFKENLEYYRKESEISEEQVNKLLEKAKEINKNIKEKQTYILGFGRGFFTGDKAMKYLIKREDEYYWKVKDVEDDEYEYIYKIKKKKKKLFKFLNEYGLEKEIFKFDILLDKIGFWEMEKHPKIYKRIKMEKFYKIELEKNSVEEELIKNYLADFSPQNYNSDYPHKTFEKEFKKAKKSAK